MRTHLLTSDDTQRRNLFYGPYTHSEIRPFLLIKNGTRPYLFPYNYFLMSVAYVRNGTRSRDNQPIKSRKISNQSDYRGHSYFIVSAYRVYAQSLYNSTYCAILPYMLLGLAVLYRIVLNYSDRYTDIHTLPRHTCYRTNNARVNIDSHSRSYKTFWTLL